MVGRIEIGIEQWSSGDGGFLYLAISPFNCDGRIRLEKENREQQDLSLECHDNRGTETWVFVMVFQHQIQINS